MCVEKEVGKLVFFPTSDSFPVGLLGVAQSSHNISLNTKHDLHTILAALLDHDRRLLQLAAIT